MFCEVYWDLRIKNIIKLKFVDDSYLFIYIYFIYGIM